MQAWIVWKKLFNKNHLEEHYNEKIKNNPSVGMDKITPTKFHEELIQNIDIICRKVNNCTYKFTRYKQLLFVKGANKPPRSVSIPTLRDKLTISVLHELICEVYGNNCITKMPQVIINEILTQIPKYQYFIKLDVKSFYASINQDILIKKLKNKIKKNQILDLIIKAITTNSISYPIKEKSFIFYKNKGIPEGLAISNALANIYLLNIDNKYSLNTNIGYWRYVDDILILTNYDILDVIKKNIIADIKALGLEINEKKEEGEINKGFDYLGYKITSTYISVRECSVLKIEQSLEELFKSITNINVKYIQWKLNLKISGFIINNHKYGWMFFYSQITDLNLLFHLDNLIKKYIVRYNMNGKLYLKKFVRTYFEMRQALHKTKYIPNLDNYSLQDKKDLLTDIYNIDVGNLSDEKIEFKFRGIMMKEIRDIEKDVQDIS